VLNLYGDRGNILCMQKRLAWRGIGCTVTELPIGATARLGDFDLFFIGGGQDFEQGLLLDDLSRGKANEIKAAAEDGKTFLCICGGYQMMGHYYETAAGSAANSWDLSILYGRFRNADDRQLRLRAGRRIRRRHGCGL
jgi:CobQ-like glutamine amidotransferase family enzyme